MRSQCQPAIVCAGCNISMDVTTPFTCTICVEGVPNNRQMVCKSCLDKHTEQQHNPERT